MQLVGKEHISERSLTLRAFASEKFSIQRRYHPMICGGILTYRVPQARKFANLPFLIPIHVFLYGFHLLQEAFDFHARLPLGKRGMVAQTDT